jgi:hypothetical protein
LTFCCLKLTGFLHFSEPANFICVNLLHLNAIFNTIIEVTMVYDLVHLIVTR